MKQTWCLNWNENCIFLLLSANVQVCQERPDSSYMSNNMWLSLVILQFAVFVLVILHAHQQTVRQSIQFLLYIYIIYLAARICKPSPSTYFSLGLSESMKPVLVQPQGTLEGDCSTTWSGSTTLIAGSAFSSRSPVRSQCEREPQTLCWLICIAAPNLLLQQSSLHFGNASFERAVHEFSQVCFFCLVSVLFI